MRSRKAIIICFLLLIQTYLSLLAAWRLSPTWDEINYPVSGAVALKTRSLDFYSQNPFLARVIYGFPLLFLSSQETLPVFDQDRDHPAQASFRWIYHNQASPQKTIFLSRMPAVIFGLLSSCFLFAVALNAGGFLSGLITLLIFLSCPILVSRFSLSLLEGPMFAFILASLWAFQKNQHNESTKWMLLSGLFSGFAVLSKLVALPFVAAMILEIFLSQKKLQRWKCGGLFLLAGLLTVLLGYSFWKNGFHSLAASWADISQFNQSIPFYWAGYFREKASSLLSYGAVAVKSPAVLPFIFLMVLHFLRLRRDLFPKYRIGILMILVTFLIPLFMRGPVSTIQLSPLYLGLALAGGVIGAAWNENPKWLKGLIVLIIAVGLADCLASTPNQLSYFNRFSGGSRNGYFWLADSDQDWGQSLPQLAQELKKKPAGLTVLSYSGAGDPEAYGIQYLDLISPALVSRSHQNLSLPDPQTQIPIYLAVGTKLIQTMPDVFDWLKMHRTPHCLAGGTLFFYDLTSDAEGLRWMSEIYRILERPREADWFLEKSQRINLDGIPSKSN